MDDITKPSNNDDGEQIEVKQNTTVDKPIDDGAQMETKEEAEDKALFGTYSEQPETYETADGTPTTLSEARAETAGTTAPVVVSKRCSPVGKWLLAGLAVLALVGLGALAYWFWNDAQTAKSELDSTKQQLTSAQASLKKAQVDAASNKKTNTAGATNTAPTTVVKSEDEQIQAAALAYQHAGKGTETAKYTVTVTKKELPFARVNMASAEGPGFYCILKKADGLWMPLVCGQGAPGEMDIARWGIPGSMVNL